MADTSKDTIYIDVDDEITGVIEKMQDSEHKILALVLPKRATVLQSIVNMKLLKRKADDAGKKLVLITSEHNLLPIAGAVGVHVARTLQSKPAVPPPPDVPTGEEVVGSDDEPEVDKTASIGSLAGLPDEAPAKVRSAEETIDVDNSEDEPDGAPAKKSKSSKIKIPNFDKFRTRLLLGGAGLVALIIFWIFAFKVWPSAAITIKTNAKDVSVQFGFTADTNQTSVDEKAKLLPAVLKNSDQTGSQTVAATGSKNVGEKATGTVSLKNCTQQNGSVAIPAGTIVSSGSSSYETQTAVNLPASIFSGGGICLTGTKDVDVTARSPGTSYNISAGRNFSVSGFSGVSGSNANAFAGGTDKTVTVVSQKDVNDAKAKITADNGGAKTDLTKQFSDGGLFALPATILAGKQTVSPSVKVGDEATEVTVSVQTTYTMLGVKRDDLKKLVENEVKKQIDTSKQALSDDGLDKATFDLTSKKSANNQILSVQTTATAGTTINADTLKGQIKGKKRGDVKAVIEQLPGVESVTVDFSPFWVNKTPSNLSKITITVDNNQVQPSNGSSAN